MTKLDLIKKRKFAAVAINGNAKIFIVYMMVLLARFIHWNKKAQIKAFITKKTYIKIIVEYLNYANVFLPELAMKFPEHTEINNHFIDYRQKKQSPYCFIYSLGLVELEMLKFYIQTHSKIGFFYFSNLSAVAFIFFDQK